MASTERRASELGLTFPEPAAPAGAFEPYVRCGDLLFISGQIPIRPDGSIVAGQVGTEVTIEEAQAAARLCGLSGVGVAKAALASLDDVVRVVRIGGFVNAEPGFTRQPQVIDGASKLMIEIWGGRGRHARAAVGVASLPANAAVEVDAIFELRSVK
jgi:enamine deaminase RidA (YjgF/YER057c/UK114 family)